MCCTGPSHVCALGCILSSHTHAWIPDLYIGWTGRRDNHLNEDATKSLSPVEAKREMRKKERGGDHSGGVGDSI